MTTLGGVFCLFFVVSSLDLPLRIKALIIYIYIHTQAAWGHLGQLLPLITRLMQLRTELLHLK